MAKAGRGQTRRDSKRRVLRPGESVRADGKYQYKYHIDGKPHFVYSWRLEPTDKLPKGKKPCLSLRELEKQVNHFLSLTSGFSLLNAPVFTTDAAEREFFWKVRKKSPQIHVSPLSTLDHGAGRVGHLVSSSKANTDFCGADGCGLVWR